MRRPGQGRYWKRPTGGWAIAYSLHGQEIRESVAKVLGVAACEVTEKMAADLLHERLKQKRNPRFKGPQGERVTVKDVLVNYITYLKSEHKKAIGPAMSTARGIQKDLGDERIAFLNPRQLRDWAQSIVTRGQARGTAGLRLSLLRAACSRAVADELVPAELVPTFPTWSVKNTRQGFFERTEFEAIHAALPAPFNDVAEFAYLAGWRKSEILGLRWDWVDFTAGVIRLPDTKNDEGRVVPLYADVVGERVRLAHGALLEKRWRMRALTPWVFHRNGERVTGMTAVWNRACRQVGFWQAREGKPGAPTKLMHDFRRTAARDLVDAGADYKTAMEVTGHKSLSVFMRYRIVNTKNAARALSAMQTYRDNQRTAMTGSAAGG